MKGKKGTNRRKRTNRKCHWSLEKCLIPLPNWLRWCWRRSQWMFFPDFGAVCRNEDNGTAYWVLGPRQAIEHEHTGLCTTSWLLVFWSDDFSWHSAFSRLVFRTSRHPGNPCHRNRNQRQKLCLALKTRKVVWRLAIFTNKHQGRFHS